MIKYILILSLTLLQGLSAGAEMLQHPRLLWLKGEEAALSANISSDARWTKLHERIIKESEELLNEPNQEYKLSIRKAMHHQCCETVRRVMFLSYSYRMTGDERFLKRAEGIIEGMCALDSWNPYHFLDVAEMTFAAAIAYDWLYDHLRPELRKKLCEDIRDKALIPSETGGGGNKDYNLRWMDMTSNWNQICHGSLAVAALAIYDEEPELAERIITRSLAKIEIPMRAEYYPMGAYSQGIGYWGYGTALNAIFFDAMEKVMGRERIAPLMDIPGFMQTGTYYAQLLTNNLKSFAFSDNSTGENLPEHCIFWFYKMTKDPALLYYQKQLVDIHMDNPELTKGPYGRHMPLMMIWGAGTGESLCADFENAKQPEGLFYLVDGLNPICTMRSGWEKDDIWIGFKAGNPSCPHGHMDVGTFQFDYGGAQFGVDLGSDAYGKITELKMGSLFKMDAESVRWNGLLRYNNFSHSTLTINNSFQNLETKSGFIDQSSDESRMYAVADLTPTYKGQAKSVKRAVALIDKECIVIEDVLESNDVFSANVVWNLTTAASEFSYDKNTGEMILGSEDADGNMKYVRMKAFLENPEASPKGFKVKRYPARNFINFPANEKPVDGIYFIRIQFTVKGGMKQRLKCVIVPDGTQIPENIDNIII